MLHVDIRKLGNVPDGGGWRYPRLPAGQKPACHRPHRGQPHAAVAYTEIHDDEGAATAIAVLRNAVAWFAARGVTVERVLSDNGFGLPLPRVARRLPRVGHQAPTTITGPTPRPDPACPSPA